MKIICHLFGGTKRFNELRRLLPGVLGVIFRDVDRVGNSTEECHQCPAFAHSGAEIAHYAVLVRDTGQQKIELGVSWEEDD